MNNLRKKQKIDYAVCFLSVLASILIFVMIIVLGLTGINQDAPPFVPPSFDQNAMVGIPNDTDNSWTSVYKEGMSFSAHVCGKISIHNGLGVIYFTNDTGNNVWMKLRIIDENGIVIGETGLIKPGEYIRDIMFTTAPNSGTKITMKIMAYEPETYKSQGAVSLHTSIE